MFDYDLSLSVQNFSVYTLHHISSRELLNMSISAVLIVLSLVMYDFRVVVIFVGQK